jgi:Zn-dependent protease
VAIDAAQLRYGRWGLVLAVLASSLALLAVAYLILFLVIPLLTLLPFTTGIGAAAFVRVAARLCVWMALFTLVPLPPLAGAHLLSALGIRIPPAANMVMGIVLLVVSLLGVTRMVLTPVYSVIAPLILGVDLS